MRLPFPERLSLLHVTVFCGVLNVFQLMDGTSALFSVCTTLFILIATVAFNLAGGLARPSGGWIFAYAVLVVVFGISYKVLLGEPGQGNLLQPERTIEVYVVSAIAILGAVFVTRRFTPKKSLFPQFTSLEDMRRAGVVCLFVGAAAIIVPLFVTISGGAGSLLSAFTQLNTFLPLAMILSETYEIRKSGGRRSLNAVVLIAGLLFFAAGVMSFSKQGMITPFVCWLVVAAAQRYKVSLAQLAGLVLVAAFISYYLVPYSQLGRNYRSDEASVSFRDHLKINILLLSNLDQVRQAGLEAEARAGDELDQIRFYNRPQGFADRLQMISPDDAIINATENGAVFGIFPTIFAFENAIPHFLWPGKPIIQFGNVYAHEVGMITLDEDTTTGISFSPSGEAYHQAKWAGILVLLPILLCMLFLLTDSCCGDTRESPFALLALVGFLHIAPEAGTTGMIGAATTGIVVLLVASLTTVKLMPFLSRLIVSSDGKSQAKEVSTVQLQPDLASATIPIPIPIPTMRSAEAPPSAYRWSRPGLRE